MLVRLLVLAFGAWLGGYLAFTHHFSHTAENTRKTDAVIALTGGEGRLEQAVRQLERHRAKRLLVTGVHRGTTPDDLRKRTGASRKLFECCIDIGYAAGNTVGNAVEATAWMDRQGFRSLRLVTSRTHMPRALLEFSHAMPKVEIVPDAVDSDNSLATRIGEYNKYTARLIWIRLGQS